MPLLAAIAVMLNTAMVLIVWSVMGGFLTMLLASGRSLMGDAIITWPVVGIAHYESLIERVEEDPLAAAAAPTVEAPGLLGLPDGSVRMVNAVGVDGPEYDEVTDYHEALWWTPIEKPMPRDEKGQDPRLDLSSEHERQGLARAGAREAQPARRLEL